MPPVKPRIPTEGEEQATLFNWARMQMWKHPCLALMYHIPNEGQRSKANGGRMVAEGLKKGVPDICLPVPRGRYHGLYIELKRLKGGRPTDEQKDWIEKLRAQGYMAEICNGWAAASQVILAYLTESQ